MGSLYLYLFAALYNKPMVMKVRQHCTDVTTSDVRCLQLLCLIGEAFEDLGDEICGAVINLRSKGDKLGLWTADAARADHNMRIGSVSLSLLVFSICNH